MKSESHVHKARPFEALSPDLLLNSVEAVIGERAQGHYWALNSVENRVIEIPFENGNSFVAKFYRPGRWNPEAIREEHSFLKILEAQEIPVNAPVEAPNSSLKSWGGTLFQTAQEDYYFSVFPKLRGRIKDEFAGEDFKILGRLVARLHLQGESQVCQHRRLMTPGTWGFDSLDYLEDHFTNPSPMAQRYFQVAETCIDRIDVLWENIDPQTLTIHGDCHIGNLLWNEGAPTFLDFDDLVQGPAIQDLWMLLGDYDTEKSNWDAVIECYEEFRDFPRHELRLIPALRALRMIHFSKWIAERWEDPSFPSLWPNFGTDPWWQEEIQALSLISERLWTE
jgi:Ser/Thr protein kinase RdoA (MazF antagonist)